MKKLTHQLFFTDTLFTNKHVVGKDIFGNKVIIEGVFFNWFGRNLPYLCGGLLAFIAVGILFL